MLSVQLKSNKMNLPGSMVLVFFCIQLGTRNEKEKKKKRRRRRQGQGGCGGGQGSESLGCWQDILTIGPQVELNGSNTWEGLAEGLRAGMRTLWT